MVAWIWLPRFLLRAAARAEGCALTGRAVALIERETAHPRVVQRTPEAAAEGVERGMLASRAVGSCPDLAVLEEHPGAVLRAQEWLLAALEGMGAAVEPRAAGVAVLETRGLEPLYGGLDALVAAVLERLGAGHGHDVRVGLGPNPFAASVAARAAQPGGVRCIAHHELRAVLEPLPLAVLPNANARMLAVLTALGVRTLGGLRAIDPGQVADRFGVPGLELWRLAGGEDARGVRPRVPAEPVVETLRFPEPVANLQTLARAVELLVERAVTRPDCASRAPRSVSVAAGLVGERSWRVRRVLRTPTVDARRIALTALAQLEQIPAPILEVQVTFDEWALREVEQPALGTPERVRRGVAGVRRAQEQVQATLGPGALLQVLEIEPWSRVPERQAVLVPKAPGDRTEP